MTKFEEELTALINRESKEGESDTPDFILARFMRESYEAFVKATNRREQWYDRKPGTGAMQQEKQK